MKKICILLALLVLLLCSCSIGSLHPQETQTSTTTIEETTPQPIPHKHLFEDEIITREASCTEIGFKKATCSCGLAQETVIPATGHTFGEAVITKPATCTEAGVKSITCLSCGKVETTAISATGKHTFGEAVVTKKPTCVENGEKTATCSVCGATEKTTIRATGEHTFGEAVVTKQPTCAQSGEMTATCGVCGATEKTVVPKTNDHTFGEAVVTKQPTCAQSGEMTATCGVCGATEKTVVPKTNDHTFGEAVVTKEPTCEQNGEAVSVCTLCLAQQSNVILATGKHFYLNAECIYCKHCPITVYSIPSNYDTDGDGKKESYHFSPTLLDGYQEGIHIWAGDYDAQLSSSPNKSSEAGINHWYVVEYSANSLVYKVTVPETGVYEMVIHLRLKDAQVRGAKYTVNGGSDNEQVFQTSYGYEGMDYAQMRNSTYGIYMYGITVNLVAGENTIKIEHASACPKSQHYRDFYFVKVGEYHAHVYENEKVIKPATCATKGEKTAVCACGSIKITVIPATQEHIFVNDVCTGCGKVYVSAGIVSYDFLYDDPGFAGGTITFLPETSDVYTFYWADANGKLKDYTMLYSDEFAANVEAEVSIQSFTAIPKGATHLIAVSGDKKITYTYTIPAFRLFTEEELYVFGALSDTHQGTRYGSTDIPYNHFINAAKTLWEKGAITIGICGDFSYANIESEYILHSKAIQEIYVSAPQMPIFTTTGNHESKYTGFSYDWYMQYARDVVEYDSDLDYIYFDGNELDYVVELPDGSVMIYFHQGAYDYGKSTSRLVSDEQLAWLEARLEQYKDVTVFFFFHSFLDEEVGDATSSGNEYGYPIISSTVEYKKFTELFTKYTNVIYFSGHSHWAFDSQFVEPKPGKTNYDKNIDDKDGTFATMVHIPACSTPRVLTGSGNGRSEGYIVHVYENYIVFEGYEFVKGETFAYATYIIENTTPTESTPEQTTPDDPVHKHLFFAGDYITEPTCGTDGVREFVCECGAAITFSAPATGDHTFGNATISKEPTCVSEGEITEICSTCGEERVIAISADQNHDYVNNVCSRCQKTELDLFAVSSDYDADGDGEKDIYYFSAEPAQRCVNGVWLWAGNYDKTLSGEVSRALILGVEHWYVERGTDECLSYRVTVPEAGVYEMILYMRLKDSDERGAKFIFNQGTVIEQIFETSHAFDGAIPNQVRNDSEGTYMYGIRVYLQGGENVFSIVSPTQSPRTQHFREFYFVKIAEEHIHDFATVEITEQPTCSSTGHKRLTCACGESQTISIPKSGEHTFKNGVCTACGETDIPLHASESDYDADGDGQKDIYYFSPEESQAVQTGIHVWAGDYDKTLSNPQTPLTVGGHQHWYVASNGSGYLVYYVTVPESGIYEMILHMRLKDGVSRGAKYIINEGTPHEQIFETSHAFDAAVLEQARNDTVGTYMYGVRVHLVAGENVIKITAATSGYKTQHFRDFYFVKVGEFHRHAYLLKTIAEEPTCTLDGEVIFTCTCGDSRVLRLPATQKHVYVEEICVFCGQKDLDVGIVEYDFVSDKAGFAGGTILLIPEVSGNYTLYWADENGKLLSYTALGTFAALAGKITAYTIHQNTAIPEGATRLIAASEIRQYAYAIPKERLLTSQKLYTFGAISDTHQGTRYGEESLSYNRLINAGKILSEKGAILVGINGDISYENIEREYVLHAEAIKEIYKFAPDLPVWCNSGNHESKYTGFSWDWYFRYTRDVVDYRTDLTPLFSDGNELDFVVELPDGSVIIFLHQIYYDYNKAGSRLMDDYQLDWLGARLEDYRDRVVFLFFHSQMQDKVGDFNSNSDRLDMCTYTEDYRRLDAYFKQYTNVIFFNGHSHGSFDDVLGGEYADRVINEYNGEYATLVHIPSLALSQHGYIVHVYEDCILFEGYNFGNGTTFAYATYIIEK